MNTYYIKRERGGINKYAKVKAKTEKEAIKNLESYLRKLDLFEEQASKDISYEQNT